VALDLAGVAARISEIISGVLSHSCQRGDPARVILHTRLRGHSASGQKCPDSSALASSYDPELHEATDHELLLALGLLWVQRSAEGMTRSVGPECHHHQILGGASRRGGPGNSLTR
jgi:hypothetical protein